MKLDGLGTFFPTMESKGAESPVGYNIRDYLKGVHIRFDVRPLECFGKKGRPICSDGTFVA